MLKNFEYTSFNPSISNLIGVHTGETYGIYHLTVSAPYSSIISKGLIATIAEQNYTGKECLPDILIEYNGEKLQNDKDYDVVYLNNIEEGEAQVIVVGLNKYYGILKTSFVIK